METQTLNVRINKNVKKQAQKIVEEMGLDLSSAVKLFISKVIMTKSIPFEIRTVNGFTPASEREMLKELKDAKKHAKRYTNLDEMWKDLSR